MSGAIAPPKAKKKTSPTFVGACAAHPERHQANLAHRLIQDDYLAFLKPPPRGAKEFAIPAATPKGYVGYADLVDMVDFELYEIKSDNRSEIAKGNAEVRLYEFAARRHCDKRWHAGRSYPRKPRLIFPNPVAPLYAWRMFPGVIVYRWVKREKPEPKQKAGAAVAAQPAISDLHKALKPCAAVLRAEVKSMLPEAQPGDEFIVATPPEIVLQYLNPAAAEADRALLRVPVNPGHAAERGAYQMVLLSTAAGLTLAVSFAVLAPVLAAAPVIESGISAGGAKAAGDAGLSNVVFLLRGAARTPEYKAAAGFVATFLLNNSAEAARLTRAAQAAEGPRAIGKLGVVRLSKAVAASIPQESKRVGSRVTVDGQERMIVGWGSFR